MSILSIDELRAMVDDLPDYNPGEMLDGVLKLDVKQGKANAYGVWKSEAVAVALTIMEPGTELVPHLHREIEIVTVLEGTLTVYFCETKKEFIKGEVFYIEPNKGHTSFTKGGCKILVQTIPASVGFPIGKIYE